MVGDAMQDGAIIDDRTFAASALWVYQDEIGLEGLGPACRWICEIFGLKIWVRSLGIEARDSFSERDFIHTSGSADSVAVIIVVVGSAF